MLEDRPICIFDEWAANQDLSFKRLFYHKLLPELRAAGKALLVISHDESYFDVADRVIRLQDGRLVDESLLAIDGKWASNALTRIPHMKKLLMLMGVLWGGGACGFWYWTDQRGQSVSYRTVTIKRGDLRSTINATGTLEPEEVVDVGAQVAGLIESFGTDPGELERRSVTTARRSKKARCWHGSTVHFSRPAWTRRAAVLPRPRPISSRPKPSSGRPSANWSGRRSCLPDEASRQQEYDTDLANYESAKATLQPQRKRASRR